MYTKLPKVDYGVAVINNGIVDADVTLSRGKLTFLDEAGNVGLKFKVSDGISVTKTAYSAGVKSIKTIAFAGVAVVANTNYSLSISLPNREAFYGGGTESNALLIQRTYTVSTDATPTVAELRNAFLSAIQNDLSSGVVVATSGASSMTVTLSDVNSGDSDIVVPSGATVTVGTAYVAPSGTPDEAKLYFANSLVAVGGEYTKYAITFRKDIRSNIVNGNFVQKYEKAILFIERNATDYATAVAILDSIIDGSYTPVAGFLGI